MQFMHNNMHFMVFWGYRISQIRCNAASDPVLHGLGSCNYTHPVLGVPKSCVGADIDVCAAVDLSSDWRTDRRACEAAGACAYAGGGNSVSIRECAFEGSLSRQGRHIQAFLPGSLLITESTIADYDEGSVDIVPGEGPEPGCIGYPCQLGESCVSVNQSTFCKPCPSGTVSRDGVYCELCPPGFTPAATQSACVACPFGLHSPGWGGNCSACAAGQQPYNDTTLYSFQRSRCADPGAKLTFLSLKLRFLSLKLTFFRCAEFNGLELLIDGRPRTQTGVHFLTPSTLSIYPFNTVYLPLSYNGSPGVNDVSHTACLARVRRLPARVAPVDLQGGQSINAVVRAAYLAQLTFLSTVFQYISSTDLDLLECTGNCLPQVAN